MFEFHSVAGIDARVSVAHEAFRLLKNYTAHNRALAVFVPANAMGKYRFSWLQIEVAGAADESRVAVI